MASAFSAVKGSRKEHLLALKQWFHFQDFKTWSKNLAHFTSWIEILSGYHNQKCQKYLLVGFITDDGRVCFVCRRVPECYHCLDDSDGYLGRSSSL